MLPGKMCWKQAGRLGWLLKMLKRWNLFIVIGSQKQVGRRIKVEEQGQHLTHCLKLTSLRWKLQGLLMWIWHFKNCHQHWKLQGLLMWIWHFKNCHQHWIFGKKRLAWKACGWKIKHWPYYTCLTCKTWFNLKLRNKFQGCRSWNEVLEGHQEKKTRLQFL